MRRTSRGNLLTYALWSPFYDRLIGLAPFHRGRAKAHERLALQAGERVLLVGVGTGSDLPFLPVGVEAVGVDLSPAMLARARRRLPIEGRKIELLQADAQTMTLVDDTFDAALLALILSVVPDGATCLAETIRLLKPGARAVVFDKSLPKGTRPSQATSFYWSDEMPDFVDDGHIASLPHFMVWLLSYRKALMYGGRVPEFEPLWERLLALCPNWPGFKVERKDPSLIIELEAEVDDALNRLERAINVCQRRATRIRKVQDQMPSRPRSNPDS